MPSVPADYQPAEFSLTAAVRAHLGVSTRQLGRYLGVTAGFVSHIEVGRRGLSAARLPRLLWLSHLLPPPLGQGQPAVPGPALFEPLAPLPAPDELLPAWPASAPEPAAEALRSRLRECRLLLLTHGEELARLQGRATQLAHRRWGLAQLRAVAPPADPDEAAHYARWLAELADDLAREEPSPATAAAYLVLRARVAGLRAEVAALAAG
ncbi:helix-turn-helix domain-containing protein [Hymenobacter cellulosivorans]|uniref:Helix-turn-helix domain-containing protein n=1 Tax=Hymenobacter cellulosivorans TaxID=2932249 RepID=A0ABY4F8G5_9BACT|nr:helix-turn-helix transcriptional regulator [Hymenobacter cellulosivorans]UOQ52944.1 helix-turn-helix domain-containing protein [Hymenobacter cellulosivorans]